MKNIDKIIYAIRIFLFIGHFYLIFVLLNSILPFGLFGYIFLVIYVIYVSMILKQLISKKKKYKYDLIYNFMQIGFIVYLVIINSLVSSSVNLPLWRDVLLSLFSAITLSKQ